MPCRIRAAGCWRPRGETCRRSASPPRRCRLTTLHGDATRQALPLRHLRYRDTVQQAGDGQHYVLRPRDEGQGSEAAAVLRLNRPDWLHLPGAYADACRDPAGRRLRRARRAAEPVGRHRRGARPAHGGRGHARCGRAPRRRGGAPPLHYRGGIRARRRPARDARARRPGRPGRRRARSAACAARRGGRCAGAPDAGCRRARVADVRAFATLRYEKRGAVAVVTLDRPEVLNAYNVAMRDDLYAALGAADEDPEVRALVLAGRGPAFSTGGDVRQVGTAPSPFIARAVRWRRDVWGRLLELGAATVAAVHGYAVGGGMEMALLCDLCVAADDARFALPETGLGMIPGVGGTQTLPRKAGTAGALDLVLTGRWLDARAALAAELVGRVVARARLEATALALAGRLARLDPAAVKAIRRP